MLRYLIAVGILVFIVVMYIFTYAINTKVEKPEGCEEEECSGCKATNCAHRK